MIKRFKIKNGITIDDIKKINNVRSGGLWINKNAKCFIPNDVTPKKSKGSEITLDVAFPENLRDWNDFDYVIVLDEEFCQPYTPFYRFMDGEARIFPFLEAVIQRYNEVMSGFDFLEEFTEEQR